MIRNPFPQLSHVAIAPFFNQSDEPTLDARQFSMAYFAELQEMPGFEVVPLGVVEEAILRHRVDLNGPGEARQTDVGLTGGGKGGGSRIEIRWIQRVGARDRQTA